MSPDALRAHLRDLRKRRGHFRSSAVAQAEIARLLARLEPDSLERKVFELSEMLRIPFKRVAADLGMSERHLYRIRTALYERLASEDAPISVESVVPAETQHIEMARNVIRYGHAQRGLEIVDRLLDTSLPPAHALDALTTRAIALTGQARYDAARASLEEARSLASRLQDAQAEHALRRIAMAGAYIPYRDGLSDVAIELSERALSREVVVNGPFETRQYARDLIFLAIQYEEAHNPRRGLECIEKAHHALSRLPVPPSAEIAQVLVYRALLRAAVADQAASARSDAEEALCIAQWHGLQYEEIWSLLALGCLTDMAGKPREALPFVHRAIELGAAVLDDDPLIRTLFITARIEGGSGLGDQALTRLHRARPLAQNHGLLRGILEVAEARARRQRGEVIETIESATRAIEAVEGRANTHYLGIPYLARAIAREKVGADNRDDIERALFYLDNGGALAEKARALELSFNVTGNRRHLEAAQELRQTARKIA